MSSIKIYKSKKILQFVDNNNKVSEFPIGIGKNELGTKKVRDDMRTPEGEYEVCVKNEKSQYHLSLGLNFPNKKDAEEALAEQTISKDQYESIISAHQEHGGSNWSTPIGGAIYIHGGLQDRDWSEGCVRMNDKDIGSIFEKINKGDKVLILP